MHAHEANSKNRILSTFRVNLAKEVRTRQFFRTGLKCSSLIEQPGYGELASFCTDRHRQTDRQTDRQTGRQTDRQTRRITEGHN